MQLNVINTGFNSASFNFACDQALLEYVKQTGKPVLRFYGFNPTACTIGYFQGMNLELDLEFAKENNIECVRRLTGGGAVMHDQNQFTYSLIIPEKYVPKNIQESYEYICRPIISGLNSLGIFPEFAPLNDIVLKDQKISGNAQTRKGGVVLQHGTLLLDVDVDKMFRVLLVPNEKLRDKLVASVKKRVTGINRHLKVDVSFEFLVDLFTNHFAELLNSQVVDFNFSDDLNSNISKIQKQYLSDKWNFKY